MTSPMFQLILGLAKHNPTLPVPIRRFAWHATRARVSSQLGMHSWWIASFEAADEFAHLTTGLCIS